MELPVQIQSVPFYLIISDRECDDDLVLFSTMKFDEMWKSAIQERVCVKAPPRANFISFGAFSHSPSHSDSDSDECIGHEEIHET